MIRAKRSKSGGKRIKVQLYIEQKDFDAVQEIATKNNKTRSRIFGAFLKRGLKDYRIEQKEKAEGKVPEKPKLRKPKPVVVADAKDGPKTFRQMKITPNGIQVDQARLSDRQYAVGKCEDLGIPLEDDDYAVASLKNWWINKGGKLPIQEVEDD